MRLTVPLANWRLRARQASVWLILGTLVGEARPARTIVEDEFWMYGFSTGIEVKW